MPPNSKAKNFQKPMIKTDKLPVSTIIEKDGPIVDSPVAIDSEELHQEGSPQNVRAFTFALTPLHFDPTIVFTVLFLGFNRASPG